jgi:arginyl-tRNA synthetase
MPSVQQRLEQAFRDAIREAFDLDADPVVTVAQNEKFGDYQSNAAMGLVRAVSEKTGGKANPRAIAEQVRQKVTPKLAELCDDPTIAGPGFINVRLKPGFLSSSVAAMARDPRLGVELTPSPTTIVLDYSAPNVAKEMHVGHLRTTIIGDAFARVFAFLGHRTIRQNHLGDWGTQFGMLIAHLASVGDSDTSQLADLEGFYRAAKKRFDEDPAFAEESRRRVVRLQAGEPEELAQWQRICDVTRAYIASIYDRLGVLLTRDDEKGESFYNPMLPAVVADLLHAKIAEESDGAVVVRVPGYEAPLIIRKSDGGYGYGTTDLAAVRYRVGTLHADRVIYVVGLPQSEHLAKVFWTAQQAGWTGNATLEHAGFGSVLGDDGKIFRTRAGGTVKLATLLDEAVEKARRLVDEKSTSLPETRRADIARAVGIGAVKYADLSRDRVGDYIFSFDSMLSMDGNTAPYLQYAYARIRSIFRKAAEQSGNLDLSKAAVALSEPAELALAKHLLRLGDVIALVTRDLKPHVLCGYLYELATKFSGFYESCPVLKSDEPTRSSRLILSDVTARTLALGLDLLGIEHPEQM